MTTDCQFEALGIAYGQAVTIAGAHVVCDCGYILQNLTISGLYNGHGEQDSGAKVDLVSLSFTKPVVCPDCRKRHRLLGFPCGPAGDYLVEIPIAVDWPVRVEDEV